MHAITTHKVGQLLRRSRVGPPVWVGQLRASFRSFDTVGDRATR